MRKSNRQDKSSEPIQQSALSAEEVEKLVKANKHWAALSRDHQCPAKQSADKSLPLIDDFERFASETTLVIPLSVSMNVLQQLKDLLPSKKRGRPREDELDGFAKEVRELKAAKSWPQVEREMQRRHPSQRITKDMCRQWYKRKPTT